MIDNKKNTSPPSTLHPPPSGERIAKRIARAGLCSRREAEQWIAGGMVKVNGKAIESAALNVTENDVIVVDGQKLADKHPTRLWLYHKPTGLITTHKDPAGRPTVFQALPPSLPRVISVGRLDLTSEGLLLLTNDGELARKLELPSTGWIRRYRVRVFGHITPAMIAEMKKGIVAGGIHYGSAEVVIDSQKGDNCWLTIALKEGKNREVRKLFEHFGCRVSRLIRISYGPFMLGSMEKNEVKEVPAKTILSFVGK